MCQMCDDKKARLPKLVLDELNYRGRFNPYSMGLCDWCGEELTTDNNSEYTALPLCADCAAEAYTCDDCGDTIHSDNTYHTDWATYCQGCYSDRVWYCDACGEDHEIDNETQYTYNSELLCYDGLQDLGLIICETCDEVFRSSEDPDHEQCDNCYVPPEDDEEEEEKEETVNES